MVLLLVAIVDYLAEHVMELIHYVCSTHNDYYGLYLHEIFLCIEYTLPMHLVSQFLVLFTRACIG